MVTKNKAQMKGKLSMDDFIGGNDYNQKQEQLKTKKLMKIISIILVILLIVSICLIAYIYYLSKIELKILVNGTKKSKLNNVLYITEEGKVYVPIRAFASYVGYQSGNGGYKQYSEDTTKCYVQNENEVATFELKSNKIYKYLLDGSNDIEYFEIDEPVLTKDGQLYTTIEGAKIAFNISMNYNRKSNKVTIYTLPYLVNHYASKFKNNAISNEKASFSNKKVLLYDMIILKNSNNNYGVYKLDGTEIIGAKYSNIKFIESTKEFIVTTMENKMGIMMYDSSTKIKPEYDSIKKIDKDAGLYLVSNNKKQGVINENGSIIVYIEYDKIGLDNINYDTNIKNKYLLYDNCIPVCKNNKWELFDKTGNKISKEQYDALGCSQGSGNASDSSTGVLLIPKYEGIVIKIGDLFGIIDKHGNPIINTALQKVYTTTSTGETNYYMIYNNQVIDVISYIETYIINNQTNSNQINSNEINSNQVNSNEVNSNQVNND